MSALRISSEERARRDALDEMLAAAGPAPVTDRATLEDMLAEGETVRRRGREFICIPPNIRDLMTANKILQRIAETTESGDQETQIALHFKIAGLLFWVRDGEGLRPATRADMEPCWTIGALSVKVMETLNRNGLETDPKNA